MSISCLQNPCFGFKNMTIIIFLNSIGATVSFDTTERILAEGNNGDLNTFDVCITLDDVQSGLMRELKYTVSAVLGTAGTV